MRYYRYLTENSISKALDIPEPAIGKTYPHEKVKRYLEIIDSAISEMTKKEESEANDAIVSDLRDKKKKWQDVKKETKPVKTKLEVPPDQQQDQEPPPEPQGGEEPPPPPEKQQESRLLDFLKKML